MKATVGETLRTLNALEELYVVTKSVEIIRLVLMCVVLALEESVDGGMDVDGLARELATGWPSVAAASLFDTTDPKLQPLSARYREDSRMAVTSAAFK